VIYRMPLGAKDLHLTLQELALNDPVVDSAYNLYQKSPEMTDVAFMCLIIGALSKSKALAEEHLWKVYRDNVIPGPIPRTEEPWLPKRK
jgi:hypothetical protein